MLVLNDFKWKFCGYRRHQFDEILLFWLAVNGSNTKNIGGMKAKKFKQGNARHVTQIMRNVTRKIWYMIFSEREKKAIF